MTDATPLDLAFCAMDAAPGDDALRLRFYACVADAEMFLLLAEEAGSTLTPRLFDLDEGPVLLVFDREDRLAAFLDAPAPYAALPGRVIATQLAGQGIGIGLNLGVAPSSYLLPADAVDWLADTLGHAPQMREGRPRAFHPPQVPKALVATLDAKLARAGGMAAAALLAGVEYDDGRRGHMLAFVGAVPGAEGALAKAAGEALTFSGIEAGEMDVTFLDAPDPALPALARVALAFDLPVPEPDVPARAPAAPGSDPNRPPRLR